MPALPARGVPASAPVPGVKVMPLGSAPLTDSVGAGTPLAATVKLPGAPTMNVAALALLMPEGWFTTSVNPCVALAPIAFEAVTVIGKLPPEAGVPESSPPVLSVTPEGSVPVAVNVGAGKPV